MTKAFYIYFAWFYISATLLVASYGFYRLLPFFKGQALRYAFGVFAVILFAWAMLELAATFYALYINLNIEGQSFINYIRLYCRVIFKTFFDLTLWWVIYKLENSPTDERAVLLQATHIFGNLNRTVNK